MVINPNSNLKIESMKKILFLSFFLLIIILLYNYVLTPVELDILQIDKATQNVESLKIKIIPKNELGFPVPFLFSKIQHEILEGSLLVEIESVNSTEFIINTVDTNPSGKILIKFELRQKNLQAYFEYYFSSQKV